MAKIFKKEKERKIGSAMAHRTPGTFLLAGGRVSQQNGFGKLRSGSY